MLRALMTRCPQLTWRRRDFALTRLSPDGLGVWGIRVKSPASCIQEAFGSLMMRGAMHQRAWKYRPRLADGRYRKLSLQS